MNKLERSDFHSDYLVISNDMRYLMSQVGVFAHFHLVSVCEVLPSEGHFDFLKIWVIHKRQISFSAYTSVFRVCIFYLRTLRFSAVQNFFVENSAPVIHLGCFSAFFDRLEMNRKFFHSLSWNHTRQGPQQSRSTLVFKPKITYLLLKI